MRVFNIERTLDDGQSPDFDHVSLLISIPVGEDATSAYVIERQDGVAWDWAPDVSHSEATDVDIMPTSLAAGKWEVLTGSTGQHGYNGAVMHPSEQWSQCHVDDLVRLADHPGHALLFTIVEVRDEDGSLPDGDPIGWAVAYKLVD
ncbi:hypothetical protein SEA_QUAMMI_89 [Microbacterium phage Quammi]|nr:hypothetical protein SEA_QUAMMI_89 [Microbacterium phage Quammi]UVG33933.1 hypothetical protein SEA_VICEROY_88 [Microbacterium phage Viceroy]